MTDTPPDHMSTNPRSPHFDMEVLQRGIGIRFKGKERTDVEEYSISEGWIRVAAGKSKDRFGQPMTIKLSGEVEAWFEAPLAMLLDPASWTANEVFWRGANRRYLELDWQGFRIWGVTAAIIANLSRRISLEALRDAA